MINNARTDDIKRRMDNFDRCSPGWRSIYNDFTPAQVDEADYACCRSAAEARAFLERKYGAPLVPRRRVTR